MKKEEVRARIEEIGIVPAIRVSSTEEARFAAAAVSSAGIPIVEITMTVPEACELIHDMVAHADRGHQAALGIQVAPVCVLDDHIAVHDIAVGVAFARLMER